MGSILGFPLGFSAWLAFLYVVARLVHFSFRSLPGKNYPPGPRSFPFIGNVRHFAGDKPFLQFTELGKKYGDIVGLKAGPANIVIINSVNLVRELFEKRGRIYSGRPFGYVPREHIVRDSQHIIYLQNDDYLRQWRTAIRYILGSSATEHVLSIQEAAAADLMMNLVQNPSDFVEQFRIWALVVPMRTICGDKTTRKNRDIRDWFFDNQVKWLSLLTPGTTPPVDIFPVMKYMPEFIAKWKHTARVLRKNQTGFYYMMLDKAKREVEENSTSGDPTIKTHESLMAKILREQQNGRTEFSTDQLAYLGGGLFDAAIDTTYSTALTLIMALAAHPNAIKRVQEEVDALHGSDYPPRSEDIGKLPYLKACYTEMLRWRPVVPTLLPHLLDSDDTVGGYHLEKGTVVLQNTWGINHDPEVFENPEVFNPDRFLEDNPYGTKMSADEARAAGRKQTYIFGVGRRKCPGDLFAQNSVLIAMAKLVWAFNMIPMGPIDTTVETGFHGGLVISPENLKVDFVPRSDKHRLALVEDFRRLSHLIE